MDYRDVKLEEKLFSGFERISEVIKSLLWDKAKVHSISPIQIQIIIFISKHDKDICNVSSLSREFDVTKATISDAVRVLVNKELLAKDYSPIDNRRFNLVLTTKGKNLLLAIEDYSAPVVKIISDLDKGAQLDTYNFLTSLISQLNENGLIKVQRTCFSCVHYHGDKKQDHFCKFMKKKLQIEDVRLDCSDFSNSH